jgi:hypothetical protein
MLVNVLGNPVDIFLDSNGAPLQGGSIYIGQPNTDPTNPANQITVYQDQALSIPLAQPIKTNNGQPWLNGSQIPVYLGLITTTYSIAVMNAGGVVVMSLPSVAPFSLGGTANGSMLVSEFISSILPNPGGLPTFIAGTTTQLTLGTNFGSGANLWVDFDGTPQHYPDDFTLTGTTLNFTNPIPVGVNKVYVKGGATTSTSAPSAGSVTDASVAAGAGIQSSKLSYNQGGAGAVTRTILARLQDIVSVKDFGAKGDGTTNDTAAFQAAMNWIAIAGGELYVPPGTYIVNPDGTSVLTWSATTPLRMRGAGAGASILQTNSTGNASIFNITNGTIELSDIGLYGPESAAAAGTLLTTSVDHKFTRVDFCRYFKGLSLSANIGLLDGCHFGTEFINGPISASSVGAYVNGYAGGLNITNCIAYVPSNPTITPFCGINIVNAGGVQISNSNIIRQGTNVLVNPQSGQGVASLQISNCYLDSAQTYNLWIVPGAGASVSRTFLNQVECSSSAGDGININGLNGTVDGVLIVASQANFCAGNGITITGANAKNIDIIGGEHSGNVGAGISVSSGASVRVKGVFAGAGYGGGANALGFFCDESSSLSLRDCTASGNTTNYGVQPSTIVQNCDGFVSANTGASAIPTSGTFVTVPHGLSGTPLASQIQITPNVSTGSNPLYLDTTSITSTSFDVHCSTAATGPVNFSWRATCNGQQ